MENNIDNFDEKFKHKENKIYDKLNRLENKIEKISNYIKENNDKKVDMENKLNIAKDQYNNLLLGYNQSKNKLHEAGDSIDESEKIRETFNYQNTRVTELESKLNEKNKNIDMLKKYIDDLNNKNIEILIEKNEFYEKKKKEINELKQTNNTHN